MHVLCAPPAFILSQDQTLLLLYLYFRKLFCYIINLFKIIYLDFRFISFLKIIYFFGTTFRLKCNNRFGFISKGFNCLLFNVLFPFLAEQFVLYYAYFILSITFFNFFLIFLKHFLGIKKLVIFYMCFSFCLILNY